MIEMKNSNTTHTGSNTGILGVIHITSVV